jgi:6-phosphogluconolactonase (cycloisomerase 2 family)
MAMKRSFLQLIALLLGAISLVNCSNAPSCVRAGADTPVQGFSRIPAATASGCPVGSGGGGGGGGCSNTLTPTDVLFAQTSTGAITTLAINTPVGTNLSLMCTTANAGKGAELTVANVLLSSKNFLYALSIPAGTIDGFAIGHVAPVTLTAVVHPAFSIWAANGTHTVVEMQADPSGRFLTVTDTVASMVHVLLIDPNFGTLKEAAGSPFTVANALFTAVGSAVDVLYVTDQSDAEIRIFSINVTSPTQVLTEVTAISPFFVLPFNSANAPIAMQVNQAGTFLYTANTSSISFYPIDPTNGSLSGTGSPLSFVPQFNPQLLTMDVTGNFLYALGQGFEGVLGFTMNANGRLTLISGTPTAGGSSVTDMLVNPLGGQMYLLVASAIDIFTIGAGGDLTPVTSTTHFTSSSTLAAAKVQ